MRCLAPFTYAETLRTSLSQARWAHVKSKVEVSGGEGLRRGTAITLVTVLVLLLGGVALQLLLNR